VKEIKMSKKSYIKKRIREVRSPLRSKEISTLCELLIIGAESNPALEMYSITVNAEKGKNIKENWKELSKRLSILKEELRKSETAWFVGLVVEEHKASSKRDQLKYKNKTEEELKEIRAKEELLFLSGKPHIHVNVWKGSEVMERGNPGVFKAILYKRGLLDVKVKKVNKSVKDYTLALSYIFKEWDNEELKAKIKNHGCSPWKFIFSEENLHIESYIKTLAKDYLGSDNVSQENGKEVVSLSTITTDKILILGAKYAKELIEGGHITHKGKLYEMLTHNTIGKVVSIKEWLDEKNVPFKSQDITELEKQIAYRVDSIKNRVHYWSMEFKDGILDIKEGTWHENKGDKYCIQYLNKNLSELERPDFWFRKMRWSRWGRSFIRYYMSSFLIEQYSKARVILITGLPGTGKSVMLESMFLRWFGPENVAVIAKSNNFWLGSQHKKDFIILEEYVYKETDKEHLKVLEGGSLVVDKKHTDSVSVDYSEKSRSLTSNKGIGDYESEFEGKVRNKPFIRRVEDFTAVGHYLSEDVDYEEKLWEEFPSFLIYNQYIEGRLKDKKVIELVESWLDEPSYAKGLLDGGEVKTHQ